MNKRLFQAANENAETAWKLAKGKDGEDDFMISGPTCFALPAQSFSMHVEKWRKAWTCMKIY